jgi:hypothetical protein
LVAIFIVRPGAVFRAVVMGFMKGADFAVNRTESNLSPLSRLSRRSFKPSRTPHPGKELRLVPPLEICRIRFQGTFPDFRVVKIIRTVKECRNFQLLFCLLAAALLLLLV